MYSAKQKFGENSTDNLIICGDSLHALTSLTKIPEYRQKYVNKVKLIYIDPPFNTGQMFANYDDQLEHSVWLTMMRDRVLKAYELLRLSKFISFSHDNLLIFAKDKEKLDFNRLPRSAKMDKVYKNLDNDPRGPYKMGDFTIGEITKNRYDIITPAGKTIMGHNDEAKKEILKLFPDIEPFTTPKPERLLQRIIQIATNEGDIVLDYFAGSGTTAAVAQKLKRKWVIVEKNEDTANNFAVPRLKKVISGDDKGGISEELEYDYQPENEYFCGKKGDTLLAVVNGMLTEGLVNFLLNSLDGKKFLEIAALAVDTELEDKKYNNIKIEVTIYIEDYEENNLEDIEFSFLKDALNPLIKEKLEVEIGKRKVRGCKLSIIKEETTAVRDKYGGYNPGMREHHSISKIGSGQSKYETLKSLIERVLFVEGPVEYNLLNNVIGEEFKHETERKGIEIIPIFDYDGKKDLQTGKTK
nr:13487_t:CDS:2 [Entrophospora candida]